MTDLKHWWLYALKLEDDKYYVGITSRKDPNTRIEQHKAGNGAKWTKLHKPADVLEVQDMGQLTEEEIKTAEDRLTLIYMDRYGIKNVRGGSMSYTGRIYRYKDYVLEGYKVETVLLVLFLTLLVGIYVIRDLFFE